MSGQIQGSIPVRADVLHKGIGTGNWSVSVLLCLYLKVH